MYLNFAESQIERKIPQEQAKLYAETKYENTTSYKINV